MRGLVIDTALGALSVAAFEGRAILAGRRELMSKGHQERLGGLVRDVVAEAGGFDDLDRIAVTVGPGSFTGLRVGLAFALGLGAALGRPVVGVTTLEALAASAADEGLTLAAIDARRGEVYAQSFQDGRAVADPAAHRLDALPPELSDPPPRRIVGSGASLLASVLPAAEPFDLPAPSLEGLVAAALRSERPARPLYLRAPDAATPTRRPGQTRPGREPKS
ncbi:tRNA (adenosine(37)-N6)-threonylcarbamoyltransferase complex dimerization subunit type 1 TsaB [Brevundimonas balnearis]|uniref:tRNA (Adenosine(37)-N6)-threonylcarbamoyltransferase complex dimerization subunit type 1 TsaB n=1 Tax=Brevundimonas balnearis TaxID=1572858 RepID=A0ABV6R355_9CAUL